MGVITTADEKLDEARVSIDNAYKNLLTVLNPDTWGSDEFNDAFLSKIHQAAFKLIEIKNLIGR